MLSARNIVHFAWMFWALGSMAQDDGSGTVTIDEAVFVERNGARLFLDIKGKHRDNPVVLFLHGGPGDVILGLYPFQIYAGKKLEDDFTMVYMHQRGTGNSGQVPLSSQRVGEHIADVARVVDYLLERFGREKIHLMGHSWGGMLGTLYLIRGSEKIDRFVAVAPPFDSNINARVSYDMTLAWAKRENNADAIRELRTQIALPIDSFGEQMILSKWASQACGGISKGLSMSHVLDGMGIEGLEEGWQTNALAIARAMDEELQGATLTDTVKDLTIPILFMAAVNDANVPPDLVREVFETYKGPKDFVLFQDSHHLPFVTESDAFVAHVHDFLMKEGFDR
ncbi:MAG: alpha/beta hydrolase [Muricauda sp. TMED12]|nr:MAG: alpha/beta hydrolase [Muricauda sp. TMED12]